MPNAKRKAMQRLKYIRKGGPCRRVSDQSIWQYLRIIENVPAPKTRLLQSVQRAGLE